jgi:hypothetical protein
LANPFPTLGTYTSSVASSSASGSVTGSASDQTKNDSNSATPKKGRETQKRHAPPQASDGKNDGDANRDIGNTEVGYPDSAQEHDVESEQPPKKKRRVILTRVGDLDS